MDDRAQAGYGYQEESVITSLTLAHKLQHEVKDFGGDRLFA
jgi:hypothetical protein